MLELENKIREYYKNAKLLLPKDAKHRHFRFFKVDGSVIKVKDRISSIKRLRRTLIRFAPISAYCTVSYWLNPTVLQRRSDEVSTNCFLGSDFLCDIDVPFLEGGREETIKAYEFFERMGYKPVVMFTGSGTQLHVYDFFKDCEENPIEREKKCLKKMRELSEKLEEAKIMFDESVSNDTRRLRKVENTLTKYGNICEIIDINKIDDFVPKKVMDIVLPKKRLLLDELRRLS
jgi:DNA primase catalytic subunit